MKLTTLLNIVIFAAIFVGCTLASVSPIWLSPLNVTVTLPNPPINLAEPDIPKGQWTSLNSGIGTRKRNPVVEMDSKGILWIVSGDDDTYYCNAVWAYDPKTDLYRWVAGTVSYPNASNLAYGPFGTPNVDVFPGGANAFAAHAIDLNDNIWMYGGKWYPVQYDFWRFNTTSYEFTYFGNGKDDPLPNATAKGVPSIYNYPGQSEAGLMFADSKNNLWMFAGNFLGVANTVWHFNTTSFMWTWVWGQIMDTDPIDFNATIWNGRYYAGGFIDSDDRIWIFGGTGYGTGANQFKQSDWGDLWSFDTKTLTWRVEFGSLNSYKTPSAVATVNFGPGNFPSARQSAQLVDRLDGTIMLVGGYESTTEAYRNDVWLFNKTSKYWKTLYGDVSSSSPVGFNLTAYRQAGNTFGSRTYYGSPSGRNTHGHFFIVAGETKDTALNDIWVIPQNQCIIANECDAKAVCAMIDLFSYNCTCSAGYIGDGKTCSLPPVYVPMAPVSAPVANSTPKGKTSNAGIGSSGYQIIIAMIMICLVVLLN